VSCSTSSTLVNSKPIIEKRSFNLVEHQVHMIDTYISKIDTKAKATDIFNSEDLIIHGNERKITTDEFKKNIVLKNNSIVRVAYNNHLHNNFIKSKVFYYDKNELVCIKIKEVLPNLQNKSVEYKRTIYIEKNQPISDSDDSNSTVPSNTLVNNGLEYLKDEYSSMR